MYAVLFDLDDTLYPERAYVRSGFQAVARALAPDSAAQEALLGDMLQLFAISPAGVFERLLERWRAGVPGVERLRARLRDGASGSGPVAPDAQIISHWVQVYRTHRPDIQLYPDVEPTISTLRRHGVKLGVITDGRAEGQHAKLEALGVPRLVDAVVVTDDLGPERRYWKPHVRPFEAALSQLGVPAQRSVYVGDNPTKDFHGPARLGMRTVRIHRADALNLFERAAAGEPDRDRDRLDAEFAVDALDELLDLLREWSWLN